MSPAKREKPKRVYKIVFHNQGKICEIYAGGVSHGAIFGFVEVEDIRFGEGVQIVVDPGEEDLKREFEGVSRTYIPMHAVVRIDEVEKEGQARVTGEVKDGGKITTFPMPVYKPDGGK